VTTTELVTTTTMTQAEEKYGFQVDEWVYWQGADADIPEGTPGQVTGFTNDAMVKVAFPAGTWGFKPDTLTHKGTPKSSACDKSRCASEQSSAIHTLSSYHAVINTKDAFKNEIYNEGPFYTSFYIYEDFTWFFSHYPQEGYDQLWGEQLGGHAVVLVGWRSCKYHANDRPSLLEEAHRNGARKRTYGAESPRRRTRSGECWELRNSWSDQWADSGFFLMKDTTLTPDTIDGPSLHISSTAGDNPRSN